MFDLFEEFKTITALLTERRIDYALCGGLAMAVYAKPRATVGIDLLILSDVLEDVLNAAREVGFRFVAKPMSFAGGAIEIRRISKIDLDSGEVLMLDLLLVTPQIEAVWKSKKEVEWEGGTLKVVSREGLIELKSLRGSGQDLDDINCLQEGADES